MADSWEVQAHAVLLSKRVDRQVGQGSLQGDQAFLVTASAQSPTS